MRETQVNPQCRYRGSGRTATTGEVFLVRAVSRGISQPLTHRLSLRAEALIRSVHVLYRNGHGGSWRVTADFTHQRSCICTLIPSAVVVTFIWLFIRRPK
ncbi:hypothetical protein EI011_00215 [Escherichia coli]|nr:hypothetical protein [Escherichia coli]